MTAPIARAHTNNRMSQLVRHGDLLFLAGQVADSYEADVSTQTREVLAHIATLLAEGGSGRDRLLSAVIHLKDIADFSKMNVEWEAWMPAGAAPARTTVQATLAHPDLKVEITVIAAVG